MREFGVVADVLAELHLQESYYDIEERVFHEAIAVRRPLEPRFDEMVDAWLRQLVVPAQVDKLHDWIWALTKNDMPCAAAYFEGPPGAGKSMFVDAAARLWSTFGAANYEKGVAGTFNPDIKRVLIVLDEGLSVGKSNSASIRNLIATLDHTVNDKHTPLKKVRGAVRVVITANNRGIYGQLANENLGKEDVEAIAQRFIHFTVSPTASEWLSERNADKKLTTHWVSDDILARHLLWIAKNRTVKPGKRFLVEGETDEVVRALVTRGSDKRVVLEWLTRYMTNPEPLVQVLGGDNTKLRPFLANGKLIMGAEAMLHGWTQYSPEKTRPDKDIHEILKGISIKKTRRRLPTGKVRGYKIDVNHVFDFSEDTTVGDPDTMRENLNREQEDDEIGGEA